MSEEIITIDPTNLGEVDDTQAATDTEVSVVVHPLELKISRLVTSCREEKEKADTAAARAAASTPNTPTGLAPWSGRSNPSLGLERTKLPVFSGKLADYPSFKEDWGHLVKGNLDSHMEMVKIRENVPKDAKVELRNLRSMADVWKYLDHEYGRDNKLAAERIAYLHAFQCSKSANTTVLKFKELHACWREVYTDLDKVGAAGNLDNPHALNIFVGS